MTSAAWAKLAFGVACVALALASAALTVALRAPSASPAFSAAPLPPAPSAACAPLAAPPLASREPPAPPARPAAHPPPPLTAEQQAALARGRRAIWEAAGLSWSQPESAKGPEFGPGRASCVLATSYTRDVFFRRPQGKVTLTMAVTRSPDEGGAGGVDERVRELLGRAEQRVHAGAAARAYRLDLDGVRGVAAQAAEGAGGRGPGLHWVGYRERGAALERVEVSFEASAGQFARHLPTALAVLYSFRFFGAG